MSISWELLVNICPPFLPTHLPEWQRRLSREELANADCWRRTCLLGWFMNTHCGGKFSMARHHLASRYLGITVCGGLLILSSGATGSLIYSTRESMTFIYGTWFCDWWCLCSGSCGQHFVSRSSSRVGLGIRACAVLSHLDHLLT